MKQREAVFKAIQQVVGSIDGKVVLTKEQTKAVVTMVAGMLHEGEAELSADARAKYNSIELLISKYVPGLVNNWLRKDVRLNGGVAYVAKNPGSRAGSGDELLKSLKALKATLTDPNDISAVDCEIAKRIQELKPKASTENINLDILPEHLRRLIG